MAIVSVEKLAQAMNISVRRVQLLCEEGMPRHAHGAYDLGLCMSWYIRHLQAALESREIPQVDAVAAALKGERQRLTKLQADQVELELQKARGQLVSLELFESRLAYMITSSRQRILQLPGRVAHQLVGLDAAQIKTALTREVHATLTALAKGSRRRARPAAAAQPTNGHAVTSSVGDVI